MRSFAVAAVFFFALLMVYSWQHFSSIEYGYRIETEKAQLQHLQEENRQLGLTEAQLTPVGADRSPCPSDWHAIAATRTDRHSGRDGFECGRARSGIGDNTGCAPNR